MQRKYSVKTLFFIIFSECLEKLLYGDYMSNQNTDKHSNAASNACVSRFLREAESIGDTDIYNRKIILEIDSCRYEA